MLRRWPLLLNGLLLAALLTGLAAQIRSRCDGRLVYGLDDAYIHLAGARNLIEHGTWGVSPGEFSATSSSLLWPLLLAIPGLLGVPLESVPLLLNGLLLAGILVVVERGWRAVLPAKARFLSLAGLVLVIPAASMVFDGMEHLLHILLALLLLEQGRRAAGGERGTAGLLLLAMLSVSARYESLFLVAAVAGTLWRRPRLAAGVLLAGVSTPLLYGVWAVSEGWPPLPTGILMKTAAIEPTLSGQVLATISRLASNLYGLFPVVIAGTAGLLWWAVRPGPLTGRARLVGLVVPLHVAFAGQGNLFRYEAWLYALLAYALAPGVVGGGRWLWSRAEGLERRLVLLVAVGLVSLPLLQRGLASIRAVPRCSADIHRQQIQMARLLRTHFPGQTIAINDLGIIAWEGAVEVVDLAGLATASVAALKRHPDRFAAEIDGLVRSEGAALAIIYDDVIGRVPDSWALMGRWTVPDPRVLGGGTVSFYALTPAARTALAAALAAEDALLPQDVRREYIGRFEVPRDELRLHGAARLLDDRVALYEGFAEVTAPRDGTVVVESTGPVTVHCPQGGARAGAGEVCRLSAEDAVEILSVQVYTGR